jgi:hypothetical protein
MARNLLAMARKLVKFSRPISPWREICSPWRVNWFWPKSAREARKRSPWRVSSAQKLLTRHEGSPWRVYAENTLFYEF